MKYNSVHQYLTKKKNKKKDYLTVNSLSYNVKKLKPSPKQNPAQAPELAQLVLSDLNKNYRLS